MTIDKSMSNNKLFIICNMCRAGEEIKKKEIQVETVRRETKEIGTQVERIRKEKGIQVETGIEGKTSGRED